MTAPTFLIVPQHVARNPVARDVQKRKVTLAVRDFQTRVHMLAEGEIVRADMDAAMHVLAVASAIVEMRGELDQVIRGAMSACVQCAERGFRWHTVDAVALDQGLARADAIYARASAVETQRAYLAIERAKENA